MGIFWTNQHWGTDVFILGHKVFYRIFREKFLELTVELACQSLVVGYDQGGLVQGGDDVCHGKGFARTRDAQQSLELIAFLETFHKSFYGRRLITGGFVFGMKLECLLFILHKCHLHNSIENTLSHRGKNLE